jgi:hypothetical protein
MNNRSLLLALTLIGLSLGLFGCASQLTVQVNAISDTKIATADSTRYVLLNGNGEGLENDLFFREFSAYFIPLLTQKGYQQVATRDKADIEIFFRYAVSDGRSGIQTFAHPIYETFGGNVISFTETKTDSSGTTTTTQGTVHVPLQTQYVGTSVESRSYTEYTCSAALEAYSINSTDEKTGQPVILWKTLMSSTGDTNDIRTVMPFMAAAAAPYLAGNSGTAITVRLKPDDPRVVKIKQSVIKQ